MTHFLKTTRPTTTEYRNPGSHCIVALLEPTHAVAMIWLNKDISGTEFIRHSTKYKWKNNVGKLFLCGTSKANDNLYWFSLLRRESEVAWIVQTVQLI